MKKTILILSAIILFLGGCKKFDEIEPSKVEIKNQNIERGWDYIKISGEYDYPVVLEAMTLYLSENEDMSGAKTYECIIDGKTFSVEADGLKDGTKYYRQYEYDNGYVKEKRVKGNSFTIGKPVVITDDAGSVTAVSAVLSGEVTNNDASNKIEERGFCWGTEPNPTIEGEHYNNGGSTGTGTSTFTHKLTDLQNNETYHFRTYARTNYGIIYGEEKSFKTAEITLPTVMTNNVTNIAANSAICGGNVTSDGNGTVTARGVCWSTSQNPTINDDKASSGSGTGSYTSNLTKLTENTTYYVRAYATNEKGTSYGEEKSFKTKNSSTGTINGHDWVDLGLPSGLKWATCNVGANNPEDYGNYYAWGETTTKSDYSSSNSTTYGLSISQLQSQGYIDGSGNLTPSHDAATANWGGSWRMPTKEEKQELLDNCTWTWTTQNGVNGCKGTGPNGNHIFLPAAGFRFGSSLYNAGEYGHYWSSTPYESDSDNAWALSFGSGSQRMSNGGRYNGPPVRPISE